MMTRDAPSADDLATIESIVYDMKEDSAVSKRKRHALSMARGRSRQRETLARMRNERAHLQAELQRALDARRRRRAQADTARNIALLLSSRGHALPSTPPTALTPGAAATQLFPQYAAAVELQNSLQGDIESLQTRMEQYKIFEAALQIDTSLLLKYPSSSLAGEALRHASPVKSDSTGSSGSTRRGFWTFFMDDEEPFFFEPYDVLTAREMLRIMYKDSKQFNALFTNRQLDDCYENHFLGWTVQRSVTEKQHLRFHFTKRVACSSSVATATDMLRETWKTFHTPQLYARLYRTVMISRVIQQVDASTSVILRNSPSNNRTHHVRMVTMVSKMQDYNGKGQRTHSVLTLVVEPPETAQGRNGVMFIRKGYTYITFTEIDDPRDPMVEITYGGHGDCLNEAHAMYLLIETGAVLVRWEQFVTPQRLVTAQ